MAKKFFELSGFIFVFDGVIENIDIRRWAGTGNSLGVVIGLHYDDGRQSEQTMSISLREDYDASSCDVELIDYDIDGDKVTLNVRIWPNGFRTAVDKLEEALSD